MKKTVLRLCALALVCLTLFAALVSCGSSGKTMMTLGEQEITVNMYELLLSRMKGTLKSSGYPTDDSAFWDQIISTKGETYDDYFCGIVEDEAKKMLVKLYLFEEVYSLKLPQSNYDEIDAYLADIVEFAFDGSESDFNAYLMNFGVNRSMLRENYIMEDKIDRLMQYLAGKTTDAVREEYYNENYVCFRQILFPLYEYQYETDENGDPVYYYNGQNKICYDTKGQTKKDDAGALIVDENGDVVYFTEDGHIAYDTKNGVKMAKDEDNDGYADYTALSEQEQAQVAEDAESLKNTISTGDYDTFESLGEVLSEDEVWALYPNGIYINLEKSYEVNYLDDIQAAMKDMADGEVALIRSENAYHLIMKYTLAEQGYAVDENKDWFGTFEDEVSATVLDSISEQYLAQIVVDDAARKEAKNMKTIGANKEY